MATTYSLYAVQFGGEETQVRLDDLSVGFWENITRDEPDGTLLQLLTAPLNRPELARRIAVEAARLLGKDQPMLFVSGQCAGPFGEPSLAGIGDLFVVVESDLPSVDREPDEPGDAVPSSGVDQPTSG